MQLLVSAAQPLRLQKKRELKMYALTIEDAEKITAGYAQDIAVVEVLAALWGADILSSNWWPIRIGFEREESVLLSIMAASGAAFIIFNIFSDGIDRYHNG